MAWWVKRPRWQKVTSLLHSRSPICRLLPPRLTKPVVVYSWELFSWQIAPSDMSRSPNICEPSVKLTTSWGERWTVCRLVWSMQSVKVVLVRAVLGGGGGSHHTRTQSTAEGDVCVCVYMSHLIQASISSEQRSCRQLLLIVHLSEDWLKCD